MHLRTPPDQLPAAFAALPNPRRYIAAAVFAAVFERATADDADTLPVADFLTLAHSAGWNAARRAQGEDGGQGAGFMDTQIRGTIAHALSSARAHRAASVQ